MVVYFECFVCEIVSRYLDERHVVNVVQMLTVPNHDNSTIREIVQQFKERLRVASQLPALKGPDSAEHLRNDISACLP